MDVLIAHVAHQRWSGEGGRGVERHVFALAIFRLAELCRSVVGKEVNFQRRIGRGYVPYRRLFIDAADGKHTVAAVCREAAEVDLLVGKVEVAQVVDGDVVKVGKAHSRACWKRQLQCHFFARIGHSADR